MHDSEKSREELIEELQALRSECEKYKYLQDPYQFLAQNASDMIVRQSHDGICLSVSPSCEKILGYKANEIVGRDVREFIHPDDFIRVQGEIQKMLAGEQKTVEYRCRRKDGGYFWVETTVHQIVDTENVQSGEFLCIIRDVSERKKLRQKAELAEKQLFSIFDSIDEAITISDPITYELLFANKVVTKLFGDIIGKKCHKALQGLDAPCPFCKNDLIFNGKEGETFIWEFQNHINNKCYKCVDKAIPWPDGRWVRYEMAVDITETKNVEQELGIRLKQEETLGEISRQLLTGLDVEKIVPRVLKSLLKTSSATRVIIFETYKDSDEGDCLHRLYEVTIPSIDRDKEPDFAGPLSLRKHWPSLQKQIESGRLAEARVSELSQSEADILRFRGILSVLMIPIWVEEQLFGVVAFGDTESERHWTSGEKRFLQTAVEMIGAYFGRLHSEEKVRKIHQELENRVEERTADLLKVNKQLQAEMRDRQRVTEALQEREESFRALAENSMYGIIIHDINGKLVYANRRAAEIAGYTIEEMLGMDFADFIYPDEYPKIYERFNKRMSGEYVPHQYETALLHKDGIRIPLEIAATISVWRGEKVDMIVFNNIIDRKIAEEMLRISERKFRTLSETVTTAVIILQGPDIVYANRATEDLCGYSREELCKTPFWHVVHPDFQDYIRKRGLARQAGEAGPPRYEFKIVTKCGEERWVDASIGIIEFEGRPGALVSALDITDRKRAEEQLHSAHTKLLRAREEERRLLASELHDSFAQDLFVLQLMVQRVMKSPESVPVNLQTEANNLCTRLIRDVRRLCHGLYPPALETLGLSPALDSLAQMYEFAGLLVKVNVPDIRFSPEIEIVLFRICQEAISNAQRHGHAKNIDINLTMKDSRIIMDVIDDGVGFDSDADQRTGLGLQNMKDRAIAVNGEFAVTSKKGKSCIHIVIPLNSL